MQPPRQCLQCTYLGLEQLYFPALFAVILSTQDQGVAPFDRALKCYVKINIFGNCHMFHGTIGLIRGLFQRLSTSRWMPLFN